MKTRDCITFILILSNLLCVSYEASATEETKPFLMAAAHSQESKGGVLRDINITASIKRKLFEESDVSGLKIHVTTERGRVLLTGSIPYERLRGKVNSIAKNTNGVVEVIDRLEVEERDISDTRITTLVKLRILEDEKLSALDIHVETINGKVILTGVVPDKESESRAISIAKTVNGVKLVESSVEIDKDRSKAASNMFSDSAITAALKLSYLEDEYLSGLQIHIKTVNGKVILTGKVPDEASNQRAILIAKLTNGVKSVESKLKIK